MLVITTIGGIFYPMLMAWSLYYMFASWQSQLPWFDCSNSFNTPCEFVRRPFTLLRAVLVMLGNCARGPTWFRVHEAADLRGPRSTRSRIQVAQ